VKVIFAGTPQFAATALQALLAQKFDIVAVLTQPDRPAGRGMQLAPSPVKQLALQHDLKVLQPKTLKTPDIQRELAAYAADVMVVAAYGLILPKAVLQQPHHGCLNIHASLLPRWRGAAPIQRAIEAGDNEIGITVMQMDEGLDTGDILLKKTCAILPDDTAQTLNDRLAELGAEAIIEALHLLEQEKLTGESQDSALATYAAKLEKTEARVDWHDSAEQIERKVRAYIPFPIAQTLINDTPIKIWQASTRDELSGEPGMILSIEKNAIVVACGRGALCLEMLQRPNAKALPATQFIQGFTLKPGDRFISPA
jgi:methionyl-tRNA formyltransferase